MWRCDDVTVWRCDGVTVWLCDFVTMWLCDYVTVWLCDNVTMLLCYYVTMWLWDDVTMWQCDYVQENAIPGFQQKSVDHSCKLSTKHMPKKQRKWELFNYISRPQIRCWTLPQPQLGAELALISIQPNHIPIHPPSHPPRKACAWCSAYMNAPQTFAENLELHSLEHSHIVTWLHRLIVT